MVTSAPRRMLTSPVDSPTLSTPKTFLISPNFWLLSAFSGVVYIAFFSLSSAIRNAISPTTVFPAPVGAHTWWKDRDSEFDYEGTLRYEMCQEKVSKENNCLSSFLSLFWCKIQIMSAHQLHFDQQGWMPRQTAAIHRVGKKSVAGAVLGHLQWMHRQGSHCESYYWKMKPLLHRSPLPLQKLSLEVSFLVWWMMQKNVWLTQTTMMAT